MRRRRKKFDIYLVIFLSIIVIAYFAYNNISSESRGIEAYQSALKYYKDFDYEKAYKEFGKVPSGSTLKHSALFRQARSATNLGKKELAVKKYNKIVHSNSKSSIVPISEYNMANLLLDIDDSKAKKHFKNIIKKHPTSDYAIASEYFLGLIAIDNLPENPKKLKKAKEQALINFKTYIQKAPGGRYSIKSIDEIMKLGLPLKNYDNLLIAKSYYANGDYEQVQSFLNKTTLAESWTDFAKNEYQLGNIDKTRYYTNYGLKDHADAFESKEIYTIIDNYIATYPSRKEGITSLVNAGYKSTGADYIAYLNCNEVVSSSYKEACFRTLYETYPNGQFSAESLYNIFITKYLQKKYYDAQRLGFLHLKKFPDVKSSPAITYYMGRIANKLKHYESANNYYKQTIAKFPDSYYAYRANCNLYKDDGAFPFTESFSSSNIFLTYARDASSFSAR